jgi:hypothetical protein
MTTETLMTTCSQAKDAQHEHRHGPGCGHTAVRHGDHVDYLHDGHLHHAHEDHIDEHVIEAGGVNPAECTPAHRCADRDAGARA